MNKIILIGNLTKDPESGATNSGIAYARFTIAVQRKFKNENGEYESDFINCIAWRNTAEFIDKYFEKGNKIAIEGSIQVRSYEAQDDSKRYATEVIVESAEFVQSKTTDGGKTSKNDNLEPIDDDSLPF